jgi:hypothetical protein
MSAMELATRAVKAMLFLAIMAMFVCAAYMSRAGCPACLAEFANNGVSLDNLALQLPANGDELGRTLYLGKAVSTDVRNTYEKQTDAGDVFVWLYPTQFVLACLYFSMLSKQKASWLVLFAASAVMVFAGLFGHQENVYIHSILKDTGGHLDRLAIAVKRASTDKWLCFGLASLIAAGALIVQLLSGGQTRKFVNVSCATLTVVFALVTVGLSRGSRAVIGLGALAYLLFPMMLLWLLYAKPIAEKMDGWLRRRLLIGGPGVARKEPV